MMFFKCGGGLHSENTLNILNLCQEKFEIACWLPAWDLWKFGPSQFCSRYLWVPRLCCGGLHPQIIPLKVTNAFYSYLGSYWQWSVVLFIFHSDMHTSQLDLCSICLIWDWNYCPLKSELVFSLILGVNTRLLLFLITFFLIYLNTQ